MKNVLGEDMNFEKLRADLLVAIDERIYRLTHRTHVKRPGLYFRYLMLRSKVLAALHAHKQSRFMRMSQEEQDAHVNAWLATTLPVLRGTTASNKRTRSYRSDEPMPSEDR